MGPVDAGDAKGSGRNIHSRKVSDVEHSGFVLDMGKIVGTGHLLFVLTVDDAQPRQPETSILLESEIDGLRECEVGCRGLLALGRAKCVQP